MLTEAEKKWLEERQDKGEYNFYYCQYCNKIPSIVTGGLCAGPCPMYPGDFEYEDAAEFEARVAAWQADNIPSCDFCNWYEECFKTSCARTRLKHARLAVEEEMEAHSDFFDWYLFIFCPLFALAMIFIIKR